MSISPIKNSFIFMSITRMFTTLMDNVHRFKKHWPWFFHLKNITTITTRQQNKEIACRNGDYVLAAYDRSCYIGNVFRGRRLW